ncbi:MAG: hypothetical protein JWM14_900 [Chitinophagaceae bacterium]|nr:hypothetical protein [Chitinophagaceae bacterium]
MKKLYILLLLALAPFFSFAQSNWSLSSTGYNTSLTPSGIAITDNNDVFVSTVAFTATPTPTYTPKLYKSTNAGANWAEVTMSGLPTPDGSFVSTCLGVNGSVLFMGLNTSIYKSTDAGATWTATGYATTYAPQSISVDDNNNLFVTAVYFDSGNSTYTIKLYTSANAGSSWTEVTTTGLPNSMYAVISMVGTTMYMATDGAAGIYECANSGTNSDFGLAATGFDPSIVPQSVVIDDHDNIFATGIFFDTGDFSYNVRIYRSLGGGNWNTLTVSGLSESMSTVIAAKGGNMYLGLGDGIYKATDYSGVTGISNGVGQNSNLAFYPNPAHQTITVDAAATRVELHNTLGKNILNESTKNSTVDVSAVNKGVYILQGFDANNQLLFSEKLIIDKN